MEVVHKKEENSETVKENTEQVVNEVTTEPNAQVDNSPEQPKTVSIADIIEKVEKNNFTVYFYCPPLNVPSGGIEVLFRYAKNLHETGVNTCIIYEPREDKKASYLESQKHRKAISVYEPFKPDWLGEEYKDVRLKALCEKEIQFSDGTKKPKDVLNINPEDFLIIPEGFPNIMESTATVPCKRIIFAQSWYYILNGLQIGQKWQNFNVRDVISISDGITEYLNAVMPGLSIKRGYNSINRNIFKNENNIAKKVPIVAFMAGRSMDAQVRTINVIKTFYAFFPQFKWIRFVELKNLSKEEFSERLAEAAFVLYTDEIAGFGTLPLEAMANGTHVIGWAPLGGKEYMHEKNGFWTTNGDIFKLAEMLGFAIEKYLTNQLDTPEVFEEYEKTLSNYTIEKEKEQLNNIFNEYKSERVSELKKLKQ